MRIGTPGQRSSDQIMQRFVASTLGIPEKDGGSQNLDQTPVTKTASLKKDAGGCPECGGLMIRKGNMEKCACGFAQATATKKMAEDEHKASETSVAEYYKKIFPDDYVGELTGTPDSGSGGDKVEYGNVDVNKSVGDVGVKASRVTVRQMLAAEHEESGKCEVPDSDPTPPEEQPNGKANEAGDAKVMSGDSADSVGGPGDIPASEKPNGAADEAGQVDVPKANLPSAAKSGRRKVAGGVCMKCGSQTDDAGQCPTCNAGAEQAQAQASRKYLSRAQVAAFCPECATEMERQGIKAISASFLAKSITKRAEEIRGLNK